MMNFSTMSNRMQGLTTFLVISSPLNIMNYAAKTVVPG